MKLSLNRIFSLLLCITVICLVSSCASTSDVTSSHKIQKRKYQKGFHVLKLNRKKTKKSSTLERLEPMASRSISDVTIDTIKESAAPFKFSKKYKPPVFSDSFHQDHCTSNTDSLAKRSEIVHIIPEDDEIIGDGTKRKPKNDRPPRENNYFALWVFIGTLISVALIPFVIGILLIFICILLAIKAEPAEPDGRRFSKLAEISLIIGIVALCITLAALGVFFSFLISLVAFTEFSFLFLLIGLSITSFIVKLMYQWLMKLRQNGQSRKQAAREDSKN